jgi:hypothetical protein
MAPRGYRNFNPGNIEDGDFARGLPGYAGSDGRFARFATMDDGFSAMDRLLQTQPYQAAGNINGVLNRWAPASDGNDVNAYAANVARITGFDPNDPSVLTDPAKRQSLIRAMAQHENGGPPGMMDEAFSAQARATQPPLQAAMSEQRPDTFGERAANFIGDGSVGKSLQRMGAWAQSLDNPRALGVLETLDKPTAAAFDLVKGENGQMYRINKRTGGIMSFGERGPTPGEKKVDEDYAKDFNEWNQTGATVANKSIQQLDQAAQMLRTRTDLSGPVIGSIPDAVNAFINPDAIKVRESVQEIVQQNLRPILGAQFTQQEGESLMARAFNPRLGEAENARRLGLLTQQIKSAAASKQDAADYFRQHGTLKGWQGRLATVDDFRSLFPDDGGGTSTDKPTGYKVLKVH